MISMISFGRRPAYHRERLHRGLFQLGEFPSGELAAFTLEPQTGW